MRAPGLVWEAGLAEALAEGAQLTFVSLGPEDEASNDILGWFMIVVMPNGSKRLLIKRLVLEPRLIKTFAGVRALITEFCPAWRSVTLPIVPEIRSAEKIWEMIDGLERPGSKGS